MEITASLVKELREITGAGMMDCKKALTECDGDKDKAINYLREKGIAKSAKKESRIASEGLANIYVNGNDAVIIEVNSETDFVSNNEEFRSFVDTLGNAILNSDAKSEILYSGYENDTIEVMKVLHPDYFAELSKKFDIPLDYLEVKVYINYRDAKEGKIVYQAD